MKIHPLLTDSRKNLISPNFDVSINKQCELLEINRTRLRHLLIISLKRLCLKGEGFNPSILTSNLNSIRRRGDAAIGLKAFL
jgi:hypothetical protein